MLHQIAEETRRGLVRSAGMMIGMTKAKIAVSLPPSLVRAARSAVRRGRAESVSAYVAEALADKVLLDDLAGMLDQMLAETGGPLTPAERKAADQILDSSRKKRR